MTDLFLKVLNLSFSAAWVVLAVVLARLLLKKAPRRLICALWALVALRLLFGGIEAPFSLLPSTEIIPPESLFDQAPELHSGITSIDDVVNPIYSESLRPTPGASVNPLQVWVAVFANIWLLGMAAMAIWALLSCLRIRRQVRESVPLEPGIFLCDRIDSPFLFGLFRPNIYLPSGLEESVRSHVLAHERAHIRRRDHWWKPLGFLLLTIHWFNPALWLCYVLLCRDIELACDEQVAQHLTLPERKAYSAALLECSLKRRTIAACPLAFGEVGVKQRVKSVLNYKKPAFWIILLAVVLTIVMAVGLLTNPLSPRAEIRYQGILYIQNGRPVEELPDKQQSTDILRSVLRDSISHPDENNQAVHLSWEYAGQPIVQVGNALYLQEPGGKGWLPFVQLHSPGNVHSLLSRPVQIDLTLEGETVSLREFVQDFTGGQFKSELSALLAAAEPRMTPSLDWDQSMLAINYTKNISMVISPSDYAQQCLLTRRESDWLMVYRDEEWAVSAWAFECPELDAFLVPWQNDLDYSTELFSGFADTPTYLQYHTITMDTIALRLGLPNSSFGSEYTPDHWEWEASTSHTDKTMTIRCRPAGKQDWMEIHYLDDREFLAFYASQEEPITLPNGATGTLFHSGKREKWSEIVLDTTRGRLRIQPPNDALQFTDWKIKDYDMALAIAGTLSLTENGTSLLGNPNPLGLTFRLENITPNSATLICTQDGTPWDEITTGASWNLELLTEEGWMSVMPDSTTWTAIAYGINPNSETRWSLNWNLIVGTLSPGHYRVSKTFNAERRGYFNQTQKLEETRQTVYAEFDIEAPVTARFSPELQKALQDDWLIFEALSPQQKLFSSSTPGHCTREFDDWAEVERFVGMEIANPLDDLDSLEKGNWAAAPEGHNGASRYHVTWYGTKAGYVQWVLVESGYRRDELRVAVDAKILAVPPEGGTEPVITTDSGDDYEARTATLVRGSIQYGIRVMGDPGTGDALTALLEELVPYYEELPN